MSQAECGLRSCLALDTSCAFDGRDQGSDQPGIAHDDAERCHAESTLRAQRGCTGRQTLEVLSARPDIRHVSDAPPKNAEETKAPVGHKSTKRVIFTKRKRDAGRQSNHLDSCAQHSSPNADSSIEEKLTVCKFKKQSTKRGMQSQDSPPQVVLPLAQQHRPDSRSRSKERR